VSEISERSIHTTVGAEVPEPRAPVAAQPVPAEAEAPAVPTGDPSIIGLPAFLAGAVALGLVDINFAPVAAAGAAVPIIMTATSLGLFIAAVWAARLAQNAVAAVMAIFGGFWLSFAAVALGLQSGWFAILPAGIARTVEVFLITWLVVIGLLTVGTLRLPLAYTVLFVLIDVALLVTLFATVEASVSLTKTAGWIVLAFTAVGAYLFLSALSVATGGKPYPMGRPLVR